MGAETELKSDNLSATNKYHDLTSRCYPGSKLAPLHLFRLCSRSQLSPSLHSFYFTSSSVSSS